MEQNSETIWQNLFQVLQERKTADPDSSYVASLYDKGTDSILKKIGEESAEVIIAAKGESRDALIHELADLFFHSFVLMSHQEISLTDLESELQSRFGTSGHEEKRRRK